MTHEVVGREMELESAARFLEELQGGPAALVIEGEPGIGKTTLWFEVVKAAGARGCRVLQAQPSESEAKLSYAVLADLVGAAFDETAAALPAPQERALAAVLLREATDEPVDARTTAAALLSVLTALAAEQPVLVAVDDVQWLDAASSRALGFAVRRLPPRLGLLLTRRGEGGIEDPLGLGGTLPEDRVHRLVPGPLSLAALHHLIRSRRGTSIPRPLLARLAGASGGNPLFALEARALEREAGERAPSDPLPVPKNLQELVAGRMRSLSPPARETVLIAATLSRPTVTGVAQMLAPTTKLDPRSSRWRRQVCSSPSAAASGSCTRCSRPPSTDPHRPSVVGRCIGASRNWPTTPKNALTTWPRARRKRMRRRRARTRRGTGRASRRTGCSR
jgi:AAA ATPase domain